MGSVLDEKIGYLDLEPITDFFVLTWRYFNLSLNFGRFKAGNVQKKLVKPGGNF